MHGTVTTLILDRGFGFIAGDDGREYFFHLSALQGTDFSELAEGTAVEFHPQEHAEGDRPDERPRAVNVHLAPEALPAVDNTPLPSEKLR